MKKILVVIILIIVTVIFFSSQFFIRVKINCKSQYGECPKFILDKISILNDKSLSSVKRKASKILGNEYLVSEYSLQYKVPNILQIELLIKKPTIALKNIGSDIFALFDGDGKVLSYASDSALPVIVFNGILPVAGENVDSSILFASKLAGGVYQMYQIKDYFVQDNSLLVELPGQFKVIFPLDGDAQILLGSLKLIYSNIQNGDNVGKFKEVDLRFTNPVLR